MTEREGEFNILYTNVIITAQCDDTLWYSMHRDFLNY
jgi:hypothetical protein